MADFVNARQKTWHNLAVQVVISHGIAGSLANMLNFSRGSAGLCHPARFRRATAFCAGGGNRESGRDHGGGLSVRGP